MKTTFIYALCEPGTRTVRYIGKADKPKKRFGAHIRDSINFNTHLGHWLSSLTSNREIPEMIILCEVPYDQGYAEERRHIQEARGRGVRLVNGTDGGEGGFNPSPETRAKQRAAKLGVPLPPERCAAISKGQTGEKNYQFGKPKSESHRSKISLKLRGVPLSPERCAAISKGQTGGKNHQFGKLGSLSPNFGRPCSVERREKISAALTGRKCSKEHCAAMRAGKKAAKARKEVQ